MADCGAVFVDGAAMSRTLTALRAGKINYERLVRKVEDLVGVRLPFKAYYTTHRDPEALKRREPFYDHLRRAGWTVFDTIAKLCPDGIWRDKGVDLAIALDAYRLVVKSQVSVLVLATHDEDFAELFKRVNGVRKYVIGFKDYMASALPIVATPIWLDETRGVFR